ncbi:Flp family type IVb pilin [Rosistilla ulvae]|nr:Flp family type IVb pilin [Rosistilla ulvae]
MNRAKMISKIVAFHRDEDGPTTVEYAIMLAMILGVCILSVQALSDKTRDSFDQSAAAIDAAL